VPRLGSHPPASSTWIAESRNRIDVRALPVTASNDVGFLRSMVATGRPERAPEPGTSGLLVGLKIFFVRTGMDSWSWVIRSRVFSGLSPDFFNLCFNFRLLEGCLESCCSLAQSTGISRAATSATGPYSSPDQTCRYRPSTFAEISRQRIQMGQVHMPDSDVPWPRAVEPRSHRAVRRAPGRDQQIAVGMPAGITSGISGRYLRLLLREYEPFFRGSLARVHVSGDILLSIRDAVLESGCAREMAHGGPGFGGRAYREGIRPDRLANFNLDSGDVSTFGMRQGSAPLARFHLTK